MQRCCLTEPFLFKDELVTSNEPIFDNPSASRGGNLMQLLRVTLALGALALFGRRELDGYP